MVQVGDIYLTIENVKLGRSINIILHQNIPNPFCSVVGTVVLVFEIRCRHPIPIDTQNKIKEGLGRYNAISLVSPVCLQYGAPARLASALAGVFNKQATNNKPWRLSVCAFDLITAWPTQLVSKPTSSSFIDKLTLIRNMHRLDRLALRKNWMILPKQSPQKLTNFLAIGLSVNQGTFTGLLDWM